MSLSHEMVAPDVARLKSIARSFGNVEVAKVTNKRIILWCPDLYSAKNLAMCIKQDGYYYEIKKGLKSSAWYVQAFYH